MERSANIMDKLRTYLRNEGRCGNCTAWAIEARLYSHEKANFGLQSTVLVFLKFIPVIDDDQK